MSLSLVLKYKFFTECYGQFAEVYMLLEVLSLEIYPNVTNSVETDRQRSIVLAYCIGYLFEFDFYSRVTLVSTSEFG